MIIKSKRIVTSSGVIDGCVEFIDKKFTRIIRGSTNIKADIDYGDLRVIPGLFDTHIHGGFGYNLSGVSLNPEADVKGLCKALASEGITSFFPTYCIITSPETDDSMLSVLADLTNERINGAKILGIHFEGPWLNRAGEKGIKPGWPDVGIEVCQEIINLSKGHLRLMALSPEIEGMEAVINCLIQNNVKVAYAHSDYQYDDAMKAYDKGISVTTHTGNVMTGIHHRDVGGLGASLLRDDVVCELICDGVHISIPMIDIALRVKDHNKIVMVSDCTEMTGAPAGKYKGWDDNMIITVDDKGFVLSDTGRICGSSKSVLFGVKNLVEELHIPIEKAVQFASKNPCDVYGFGTERGTISVGKYADFAVIDDDYNVVVTYSEGMKVFDREKKSDLFNNEFLKNSIII